jgi:hypothetical protein
MHDFVSPRDGLSNLPGQASQCPFVQANCAIDGGAIRRRKMFSIEFRFLPFLLGIFGGLSSHVQA